MSKPTFENLNNTAQSPAGHIVQPQSVGKYKEVLKAMKGPASYETGGVALLATDLQLTWINWVYISVSTAGDRLCHIIYPDNEGPHKQILIKITDLAGTEIANTVDLSAKKFRLHAQGSY